MNNSARYQRKGPQSMKQAEEVGLIGSKIWTQPEIIVLLREYKQRECLYDMKNVNYRNKLARQLAFDDIAKNLCKIRPQTTPMDVKLKFNILRTQYYAELTKEKKCAEGGKRHVTTLWFMDHIKFVRGHNRREIYGHRARTHNSSSFRKSEPLVEVRYEDQASLSGDYFIENTDKYEGYEVVDTEVNVQDPLSTSKSGDISAFIKSERSTTIDAAEESEMTSDSPVDDKEYDEDDGFNTPTILSPATSTLLSDKNCGGSSKRLTPSDNSSDKNGKVDEYVEKNLVRHSEEDLFGQIVSKKLKKITDLKKRADAEFKIFSILHSALIDE